MKLCITSFLFAALLAAATPADSSAQSPAFTYQGRLTTHNAPANGRFDFEFNLFGVESGGTPVSGPLALPGVGVTNGIFTVLLDFDASVFTGAERWLDIAVRPAGSGTFTPLNPRQPITPTPYAVTALFAKQVPGVSGNALHSAGGSVTNAVFVDNYGNVGIGTTQPTSRLEIAGQDALTITGFQPFLTLRDTSAGSARTLIQSVNGGMNLFTESYLSGANPSAYLRLDTSGNVGIGTATPTAKLDVRGVLSVQGGLALFGSMDVRGDIRLGSTSELRAASSEENLRIVRGRVGQGGQAVAGTGFQVAHQPIETPYTITFTRPFAAPPTVTATVEYSLHSGYMVASAITANSVTLTVNVPGGGVRPSDFSFIAIGPR